MKTASTFDSQFQEFGRIDRLGEAEGDSIEIAPPPLKFYAGSILSIIISVALLGVFVFLFLGDEPPGTGAYVLLWVGILFGFLGGFILVRRSLSRYRLQAHKNGFSLRRAKKLKIVLFDETDSVTLVEKEKLNNGVRVGVDRNLVVHCPHQKVSLRQVSLDANVDVFGSFVYWVLAREADKAEMRIRNGESIRGKHWRLDTAGLHVGRSLPIALAEMGEAGIFERKVSLWRRNEDLPFFSVDANSKGARLLLEIVRRHLPKVPSDQKSAESLGRMLFRKKAGKTLLLIAGLIGVALAVGGIWLLVTPEEERLIGVVLLLMGIPLCGYTILELSRVYQFHELGVIERSMLGSKSLRYANIERVKYEATRHYHNGVYTGTSVRFKMMPGDNEPPIKFSTYVHGSDEDMEHLREFISGLVADKMYKQLSVEERVSWGNSASLSKKGVHFSSKPLFGSKEPRNAFFSDQLRYTIDNGVFSLFCSGEKKAAMRMQCSEENFYPGFLLLGRLASEVETNH